MASTVIPRKKGKKIAKPWEPTQGDLQMYVDYSAGYSQRRLANKYGISQHAIHNICRKLDKWFADQFMGRIREIKAGHTQRLELIYREAMGAWRRSQADEVVQTEKDVGHGQFPGTDKTTVRKGQVGASEFLNTARAALNDIREIWGANAPLEVAHTGEVRVAGRDISEARSELLERVTRVTEAMSN